MGRVPERIRQRMLETRDDESELSEHDEEAYEPPNVKCPPDPQQVRQLAVSPQMGACCGFACCGAGHHCVGGSMCCVTGLVLLARSSWANRHLTQLIVSLK